MPDIPYTWFTVVVHFFVREMCTDYNNNISMNSNILSYASFVIEHNSSGYPVRHHGAVNRKQAFIFAWPFTRQTTAYLYTTRPNHWRFILLGKASTKTKPFFYLLNDLAVRVRISMNKFCADAHIIYYLRSAG